MTAIVGCVGRDDRFARDMCQALLGALGPGRSDGSSTDQVAMTCFGARYHHVLPEDDGDRQPYGGGGGQILLAADARIDNRDEIAAALNIAAGQLVGLSDCELLLRGWEQWGLSLFDRLLGDIALAAWDGRSGELALVRTPLSNRPLFYHRGHDFVAFASLPSALFGIPSLRRETDVETMADLLAGGIFCPGEATLFRGIEAVPQGHAVLLREGAKRLVKLWSLEGKPFNGSLAEAGEAMRAELDRAVRAQRRRRSGSLACQLSGGRDSSAVAASAALQEDGIIALTAAPRADFPPVEDGYWLADESGLADRTARQAGLRHIVCRSEKIGLVELLETMGRLHFQPIGNPANLPWIAQTCAEARRLEASVMLTGACGNFGLSLGGHGFLGEYWRQRGLPAWWRLVQELHKRGDSWRTLLGLSFGQLVPRPAYHALWRLLGHSESGRYELPLLKGWVRQRAEQIRRERFGDVRAPASRRRSFADIVMRLEYGDKYSLATWGVDVRDPTADRRLLELCYSLPVEALIGAAEPRPAYAAAFGDRLPREVVVGRQAGYQAADWFETIRPEEVRAAFRRYMGHPLVGEFFDLPAIEERLDRWPSEKGDSIEIYDAYCNQLLGSLALASFITVQLPG